MLSATIATILSSCVSTAVNSPCPLRFPGGGGQRRGQALRLLQRLCDRQYNNASKPTSAITSRYNSRDAVPLSRSHETVFVLQAQNSQETLTNDPAQPTSSRTLTNREYPTENEAEYSRRSGSPPSYTAYFVHTYGFSIFPVQAPVCLESN